MLDLIAFLGGCMAFVSIACLMIIKRKAARDLSQKKVPMIVIQWRGYDRPEDNWETIEVDRRNEIPDAYRSVFDKAYDAQVMRECRPSDVHSKTTLDNPSHDFKYDFRN